MTQPNSQDAGEELMRRLREELGAAWTLVSEIKTAIGKVYFDRTMMFEDFRREAVRWHDSISGEGHPDSLRDEIRRLQSIVGKLPTTRDGVVIHVGMDVWSRDGVGGVGRERVDHVYRDNGGHWIINKYLSLPLAACCAFSSRVAAAAPGEGK